MLLSFLLAFNKYDTTGGETGLLKGHCVCCAESDMDGVVGKYCTMHAQDANMGLDPGAKCGGVFEG
jgi:hypothetical protein